MGIKYECIVKNGTYTDKTGAEKNRWQKIGVCVETKQGGLAVKLETIPVTWDGWISLAEPKPRENAPATSTNLADLDSDVPF